MPSQPSRILVIVVGLAALVCLSTAWFIYLRIPKHGSQQSTRANPPSAAGVPDAIPEPPRSDYSATNVVSTLLGQEGLDDGVKHFPNQADGRTTVEHLDGVPCRYLNRTNKTFGYLYFALHDTFKSRELKAARIEIEFLSRRAGYLRLQYDAMEGEVHRTYKPVGAEGVNKVNLGSGLGFMTFRPSDLWQTLSFRVADAAFANSQNGGADFRLEVSSPQIYVRRVSVTREDAQPLPPKPAP